MSKHAWLVFLIACSTSRAAPSTSLSGNEQTTASTASAMTIFAGTLQSGWNQNQWSWPSPPTEPKSAITAGVLAVSNEKQHDGFSITHLVNDAIANVSLAPYTALSFDISAVSPALTVHLESGSGYSSTGSGPSLALAPYVVATTAGMTHVRIPLSALAGSLTAAFEIAFDNDGASASTLAYNLNNIVLEVAAAPVQNPAQPPPPAGALSIYSDGLSAGWGDWSWNGPATVSTGARMGTAALAFTLTSSTGLKLERTGAAIPSSTYGFVNFYLFNAQAAAETSVQATLNETTYVAVPALAPGTWTQVRLPMSTFKNSGAIAMLELVSSTTAAIDVDAVWLEPAGVTAPAPVITAYQASPASFTTSGVTTLTWSATNAQSFTVNGQGASSGVTFTVNATTSFVLVATGPGGIASASTTVTITGGGTTGGSVTPGNPSGSFTSTTTVDTTQGRKAISPLIYGYNGYHPSPDSPSLPANLTADRIGGDAHCTYNWENNSMNTGGASTDSAWYFQNVDPAKFSDGTPGLPAASNAPASQIISYVGLNKPRNVATMMVLPLGDYVSADKNGAVDYSNSTYLAKRFVRVNLDNGAAPATTAVAPSLSDGVSNEDEYINYLSAKLGAAVFTDPKAPLIVTLDNEPEFWDDSFAIIQQGSGSLISWSPPASPFSWSRPSVTNIGHATTPTDLINRVIKVTKMIRRLAPHAQIVGPSHSGPEGLTSYGFLNGQPKFDPEHQWFADVFLQQLHAAAGTGAPLLDGYNFHWYPETSGTSLAQMANPTGSDIDMLIQSPRAFWDTTYTGMTIWDPAASTSGEVAMALLPRLQKLIDADMPTVKPSITEYYPGGGANIAGGITEADYLGIFGKYGLHSAALWPIDTDANTKFIHGGMSMFRNFDGANGSFGDTSVTASISNTVNGSAYASVDAGSTGRVVVVLINKQASAQSTAVKVTHAAALTKAHAYQLTNSSASPVKVADPTFTATNAFVYAMPARSVTLLVLTP